jgi:hypothetical protein
MWIGAMAIIFAVIFVAALLILIKADES